MSPRAVVVGIGIGLTLSLGIGGAVIAATGTQEDSFIASLFLGASCLAWFATIALDVRMTR